MSMPPGVVRCQGCAYEVVMQFRPITLRYTLRDGTRVEAGRSFGWCHHCTAIRDTEPSFDVRAARAKLEQVLPRTKSVGRLFRLLGSSDESRREREEAEAWLRFVEQRLSPPRCLTCGKAGAAVLQFDESGLSVDFLHSCGHRLYRVPDELDEPSFFFGAERIELDTEGNRM